MGLHISTESGLQRQAINIVKASKVNMQKSLEKKREKKQN